ncbi:hypothetical protein BC829DRAFT_176187 [Chytridium lagenaria]|nr:hypothetical protein BC829DRAFT_176187 [Chytridium lagenaria]
MGNRCLFQRIFFCFNLLPTGQVTQPRKHIDNDNNDDDMDQAMLASASPERLEILLQVLRESRLLTEAEAKKNEEIRRAKEIDYAIEQLKRGVPAQPAPSIPLHSSQHGGLMPSVPSPAPSHAATALSNSLSTPSQPMASFTATANPTPFTTIPNSHHPHHSIDQHLSYTTHQHQYLPTHQNVYIHHQHNIPLLPLLATPKINTSSPLLSGVPKDAETFSWLSDLLASSSTAATTREESNDVDSSVDGPSFFPTDQPNIITTAPSSLFSTPSVSPDIRKTSRPTPVIEPIVDDLPTVNLSKQSIRRRAVCTDCTIGLCLLVFHGSESDLQTSSSSMSTSLVSRVSRPKTLCQQVSRGVGLLPLGWRS